MRVRIFDAKWICPICGITGRKWVSVGRARKYGRDHIEKYHNENVEPILDKRRKDARNK